MIVACYHPLPLSACMLNFDLVSILFSTSIPPSLKHFSENVFTLVSLVLTVCSNTYKHTGFRAEFYLPCIPISNEEGLAIGSDSYILSCTNIAY